MRKLLGLGLTGLALLGQATLAQASTWELDAAHSRVGFSVRHMMLSTVHGQFDKVKATITVDDNDMAKSSVEVEIDAASIDTREPKRDEHLRSPDFFDAAKYPKITFKSTKVEKQNTGGYLLTGNLTMHGVTHPAVLTVDSFTPAIKNPFGMTERGFSAKGKINRKEWGLSWNKTLDSGGVALGEEISLEIDGEAILPKK